MRSVMRTMLVVGDNHEELVKKFSQDTVGDEKFIKYKYDDMKALKLNHLRELETLLTAKFIPVGETKWQDYAEEYRKIKAMDDFEHFMYISKGCIYDMETGDALTDVNPNARYKAERCYQDRLISRGEEGYCSTPFILKDGSKSYSARKKDIDWDKMHLAGKEIYERCWELCVESAPVETDEDKYLYEQMKDRKGYFTSFENKEEYVIHNTAFWTYSVIFGPQLYCEPGYKESQKVWARDYFKMVIKPLKDDTLLTLYEVRSIKD